MRVKIDLKLYFNDYRSSSMLFVDGKMKQIKDLETRISETFNIRNFFLKCNDCFLPTTVSIQILKEEDIILVCPFEEIEEPTSSTSRKEKKKKKFRKEESFTDIDEQIDQPLTLNKEKNRKRSLRSNEDNAMVESPKRAKLDNSHILEPSNKKKKAKKSKTDLDLLAHDAEESSENNDENVCHSKRRESNNVKILVDSFEKKKLNLIQHPERSINIIKTIIVSHPKSSTPKTSPIDSNDAASNQHSEYFQTACSKYNLLSNDISTPKVSPITSNAASNQNDDDSKSADVNGEVAEQGASEKPKRKRVRKRKRQVKSFEPTVTVDQPTTSLIPRPLIIKPCSNSHVHFDDEESGNFNELSTRSNSPQTLQSLDNNFVTTDDINNGLNLHVVEKSNIPIQNGIEHESNTAILENVVPVVENVDKEKTNPKEVPKEVENAEKNFDSSSLSEEFIEKQPNISYLTPTLGDIVAFKVLRLNENYTPQISSYIVGKVTNFSENNYINFDIIYGQNQYEQPHGKFFLEDEQEEKEEMDPETIQQTYNLNDLFFSKRLFP